MKNISSIQNSNKIESPKTPGGISKSLLTPCRRIGLSRNWRKSGSSPFISPLANNENNVEEKPKPQPKKRKCSIDEESGITENTNEDSLESSTSCNTPRVNDIRTPSRNPVLARKKSKTLLLSKEFDEDNDTKPDNITDDTSETVNTNSDVLPKNVEVTKLSSSKCKSKLQKSPPKHSKLVLLTEECNKETDYEPIEVINICTPESECDVAKSPKHVKVTKLSKNNSKSKSKIQKSLHINTDIEINPISENSTNSTTNVTISENSPSNVQIEKRSPENLTKECMVVIQKKIFKTDTKNKPKVAISQVLFDSDSDDVPLSTLNNKQVENEKVLINEDDEFQEKKPAVKNITKVISESKNTNKVKEKKPLKNKTQVPTESIKKPIETVFDVEDDDFISNKKTIIIKKTYNKVTKPSKAKSTGSITQKDVDELMARIETKKNLLIAKSMTNETVELRNLIKKWQKGCQDALSELLELMKTKMPEQNMNYTEILQILKIPPDLVGYDSDNDCFHTPDDAKIILSDFNF